jgi:hypothetical protein
MMEIERLKKIKAFEEEDQKKYQLRKDGHKVIVD